jgi:hypothetical protein
MALAIVLIVVALAPLPFGSQDLWAIACWDTALGAALLLVPFGGLARVQRLLLIVLFGFAAVWALVIWEQVVRPPDLPSLVNPIWADASQILGLKRLPIISISDGRPVLAAGKPLAVVLALACSFTLAQDATVARRILLVVAGSGVVYASYGIVSFAVDPTLVLGQTKEAYQSVLTATFINRNTAAAYFGTCAVVWLMLVCRRVRQLSSRQIDRETVKLVLAHPTPALALSLAAMLIVLAAMFMTGSRAGVLLSLGACAVGFLSYFRRDLNSRSTGWIAIAWILGTILLIWQLLGAGISERIEQQGFMDLGRVEAYRSTLAMIHDYPWLGMGAGTFEWAFPQYRSPVISTWGTWDKAHNTLLEIAAEYGIPVATLTLLGWLIMFAVLIRGVRVRSRGLMFPATGLAIAFLSGLHSMVDFPLQVPGYAIVAFTIIGTCMAQSFDRNERRPDRYKP